MKLRIAALLGFFAALTLTPSCGIYPASPGAGAGSGGGGGAGGAGDPGAMIRGATWSLAWDLDRVELHDAGWTVTTDRGYRVHLTSGWLVDYSMSLGACDTGADAGTTAWISWLGVRSAHAHDGDNETTVHAFHAEDLAKPTAHNAWQAVFPAARYCRAHWLVGHAEQGSDAPLDLVGSSLRLAGTWEHGAVRGDLLVDTWWPQGKLVDLGSIVDPAVLAAGGEARVAKVTVTRHLGALFDGLELESAGEAQIAGQALDNLVEHATVHVELWTPSDG